MQNSTKALTCRQIRQLLIVEDDATDQLLLQRKLTKLLTPQSIAIAATRAQLLAALQQPHDLIVTDLHLPDIEEEELLATIAAAQPSTPCVIVSGSAEHARRFASGTVIGVVDKGARGALEQCLAPFIGLAEKLPPT